MGDEVMLRELRWTDLPAAQAIEALSFPVDVWSVETFWAELAGIPDRRRYLAVTVAAVPDGDGLAPVGAAGPDQLVAYGGLALSPPECDIQTLVVAPSHRGRGLGERLLGALLVEAAAQRCDTCHLEVRSDNAAAIALYGKHGFAQVSLRPDYYAPGVDAVVMAAPVRVGSTFPAERPELRPEVAR